MKTQSINWPLAPSLKATQIRGYETTVKPGPAANTTMREFYHSAWNHVLRGSAATLVILAIIVGALWGAQHPTGSGVIEALIWASGVVFLGLAIESNMAKFKGLLATGLALPILALLSSEKSIEFTLVAASLIAFWAGVAIVSGWNEE